MSTLSGAQPSEQPRTYGNWRRPRSAGLGQLGLVGTVVLMGGLVVVIILSAAAGILVGIGALVLLALGLGSLLVHDQHGRTGLQLLAARVLWAKARRDGSHLYRSGPLSYLPWGTFQPPGLAAASTLSEGRDSYERPFALLHVPATGHYTVVLAAQPDGASLVDTEQVDQWVARWGEWLASLGDEPGVQAAQVTVETAPDTGARLAAQVNGRIDPDAPPIARQVLSEIVDSYPVGSAAIRAWVTLTFTAITRGGRRQAGEMARELATRLPGLTQRLAGTGAGAARPVSAQELCELVRCAYDPRAAELIEQAHARGQRPELSWVDVGPAAAEASWGSYRHDSGISVTWAMSSAPRGEVHSSVLLRLLAPHRDIARKRVTLLYRVVDPALAARLVEADLRNSEFRVRSSQRPSARALREHAAAQATAGEEARGAALVDFGMLVTATALDERRLADAVAAVDNLAATARLRLRCVFGSQDTAFAAALPVGLVLPMHLRVPQQVRSAM